MSIGGLLLRAETLEREDPLARFRFQCEGQRAFARYVFQGLETHGYTGNEGGKTTVALAAFVAMAQGRAMLDDLPVPRLELPATFWLIVKSRRGAVDSSQAKLLELSGADRARDVGWASRALGYAEVVRIRPQGRAVPDDREAWSKFVIHSEEGGDSLPGGRIDGAIGDEPPDRENWREVRSRAKSNRPLYLAIAETPIYRSEWWWLFHEQDGFIGCLDAPRAGRVSVNWHVRDLRCHSAAHLRELEERRVGDPMAEARMSGQPVDDETSTPFNGKALALWRKECRPPRVIEVRLAADAEDEHDRESLAPTFRLEVWCERNDWGRYAVVGDPSAGIDDGVHNPSGLHVMEQVDPAVVARYSGFLDGYSFGRAAGLVGRRYSDAECFIETQGGSGYGGESIRALRRMRYPKIGHDLKQNDPSGLARVQYGFSTTPGSREGYVAAIQAALALTLQGKQPVKVWSKDIVDTLTDAVFDKKSGKVVNGRKRNLPPGSHLEDMILLGYALRRLELTHGRRVAPAREPDPLAEALRRDGYRGALPPTVSRQGGKREIGRFR